ncbi:MAG: peptidylprolyl isomerase [Fidelibacterota bacterium]
MKHFLLSLGLLFTLFAQNSPTYLDGVAAVVGDHLILKSDVAQIATMTALQQGVYPSQQPDRFRQLEEEVLQSLVDRKILLELAKLDSIEVKDSEVDAAMEQQVENMLSQAGSEERLEEALGQSIKDYRRENWQDIRDMLISERYQQTIIGDVKTGRQDVIEFYNTYQDSLPLVPTMIKLRHILLPIEPNEESKAATISFLKQLKNDIRSGSIDFADAASQYSQDPGTASRGGDLGFVRRGSLVPSFETVAFTLPLDSISDPVSTPFGYHLIQPLEKQGDKIRMRHILFTPEITDEDDSRAYEYALSLRDSISTLEDFKRLAKTYSTDEKTRDLGGDLGWVNPNEFGIPEFTQVVPYLEMRTVSPPVKTSFGYHLLWLEDIKPGGKPTLETHWSEIEMMALNQKKMKIYQDWMDKVRDRFYIRIME